MSPSRIDRHRVVVALAAAVTVVAAFLVSSAVLEDDSVAPLGVSSRLQSLDGVSPTAPEHAAHPQLALVSAMVPWSTLEPTDGTFDWAPMDANVADARARGYLLIMRVMAGRVAPVWLEDEGAQTLDVLGTDPNAADFCDRITVPVPWDPVLRTRYEQLMTEVGRWLRAPDGAGGANGDHVAIVPVAMPTLLGTEMTLSYGPDVICPPGTDGAGTNLASQNRASWDAAAPEQERRDRLERAWRDAIDIHMATLPATTASSIAYGHLFDDGQAAALRIAQSEVAASPDRLWSMYTNLQPKVRPDGSLGAWREVCPRCHGVLEAALEAGGPVGFQVASTGRNDSLEKLRAAVDQALVAYPVGFLEVQPAAIDRYEAYLLSGADAVQSRISGPDGSSP